MKTTERLICSLALSLVLPFMAGCEKSETSPAPEKPETSDTQNAFSTTAADLKETAEKTADDLKAAAARVTNDVKEGAANAASAASAKADQLKAEAQNLIARTKTLISEEKYEDALNSLKQLSNFKLTPEQQKTVDDLKAQLQKLLSSQAVTNAASKLNNLFN